jgi:hypothetical protein
LAGCIILTFLQVMHAAIKSDSIGRLHLLRNGVDSERRGTQIQVAKGNVGASQVDMAAPTRNETESSMSQRIMSVGTEQVEILLLSDIFDEVYRVAGGRGSSDPLVVLLKMDIEVILQCVKIGS